MSHKFYFLLRNVVLSMLYFDSILILRISPNTQWRQAAGVPPNYVQDTVTKPNRFLYFTPDHSASDMRPLLNKARNAKRVQRFRNRLCCHVQSSSFMQLLALATDRDVFLLPFSHIIFSDCNRNSQIFSQKVLKRIPSILDQTGGAVVHPQVFMLI